MPKMNADTLTEMCGRILELGGNYDHPEIAARYFPIEPDFGVKVDQTLDPFSEAYFDHQIALYGEVAGRQLDQAVGELHDIDIESNVSAANPLAIRDVEHVGEQVRTVATMLALATLHDEPEILDMGAGHGLAAEVYAFAGCRVTAVDIDPLLSEMSTRRAVIRNLPIERLLLNYDDLSALPDGRFEAAFFFQSLHHCLRPWDLVARLSTKLSGGGIIAFGGEPIQTLWWRHWGLRLDVQSLFVARTRGWCEMGWSREFIRSCFERAGLQLVFFSGGIEGNEIGVATADAARLAAVRASAARMGLDEIWATGSIGFSDTSFASACGTRETVAGGTGYRQTGSGDGSLVFGPYVTLAPGIYEAVTIVSRDREAPAVRDAKFEAVAARGAIRLASVRYPWWRSAGCRLLAISVVVTQETDGVEFRVRIRGAHGWTATLPTLRQVGVRDPS